MPFTRTALFAAINMQASGMVNKAERFAAPVAADWSRGTYRFMSAVPYGDGRHKGVDYIAEEGAPVVAGGVGQVAKAYPCDNCHGKSFFQLGLTQAEKDRAFIDLSAGFVYGFGNLIVVRYAWDDLPEGARRAMVASDFQNHYAFVYHAHLTDDLRVREGDSVEAGTLLGFVGNTGNSTAPHLHLEVRCLAKANPTPFSGAKNLIDPETSYIF